MIPHYFLYEEATAEIDPTFLHIEPIPVRSGRHNWTIRTHSHPDHHQIMVVSKGGGAILVEEASWDLSPPSLVIVPALTVHSIRFRPSTDGYVITVTPSFLEAALDHDPQLLECFHFPVQFRPDQIGERADVVGLLASVEREYVWSAPGRRSAIKAYLQLLAVIVRRLLEEERARPIISVRQTETIRRFREMIERNFRHHRPLDFYARQLGVTTAQLNACCRNSTGKSSLEVINDRIIAEAKRALLFSDLAVNEIGASLGYGDPAYFNRFFSRRVGMSPGRYRDEAALPRLK